MSVEQPTERNTHPARRPARRVFQVVTAIHTFLYRLSGGIIGGRMGKSPVLLLITTGRKTGKRRTTPLLYLKDGDNLVLVASYGGAPMHPLWWLNLQAKPQTEVEIGRQKVVVVAKQADPEERKRLWPLLVAMYADYDTYQKKTVREIPVIILSPQSANKGA